MGDRSPTDVPMVQIDRVHKSFGTLEVLKGIDLNVARGEVLCLLGPSGSGKSTLLRCINQLEVVNAGRIVVDGEPIGYGPHRGTLREFSPRQIARQRARIGMVFQSFNLFPHMTALENIVVSPVKVQRRRKDQVTAEARDLLAQVGLADKAAVYPRMLSGGQQQRVAIARALAMKPDLMLFDEPTSALDPELVAEVLAVIRQVAESGMTLIIVTHEVAFARDIADKVAFMEDGLVVEYGHPSEVFGNPKNARTKEFLSSVV